LYRNCHQVPRNYNLILKDDSKSHEFVKSLIHDDIIPNAWAPTSTIALCLLYEYQNLGSNAYRKAEPDAKGKMNCLLFLSHAHETLIKDTKVSRNNVDLVAQVTALIETLHNATRQQTNKVGSLNATLARV
jgi:hypothetical protein